jgi:hypothetical protein
MRGRSICLNLSIFYCTPRAINLPSIEISSSVPPKVNGSGYWIYPIPSLWKFEKYRVQLEISKFLEIPIMQLSRSQNFTSLTQFLTEAKGGGRFINAMMLPFRGNGWE